MADQQRQHDLSQKNSSYRKILDGIQKMSLLHSDVPQNANAASSKGFNNKPYKSNIGGGSSFQDGALNSRQGEDERVASFKIRS